jgi:hypothetical protein
MWLNAIVIVETPGIDESQRQSLHAAMARRGWERTGREGYSASFANVDSDDAVVKLVEQDVQQSAYVAGVSDFDSVCMLSENPVLEEIRKEFGGF